MQTRGMGAAAAFSLVVGSMIGSGVFTTSGFSLAALGRPEPVLLAWALGGAYALLGVVSYVWLARRFPEDGGEYLFLSRTPPPGAGFLAGWVSMFAGFSAPIAAAALLLETYLGHKGAGWIGLSVIAAAALLHGIRRDVGVRLQIAAVSLKLALILWFLGAGAMSLDAPAPQALAPTRWSNFATTLVWITFSYSGWNAFVYVAGELREATLASLRPAVSAVCVVTLGYLGLNAVFLYAAPVAELSGRADIGLVAARHLGGPGLAGLLGWLVAVALGTSVSAMMMAGPRVYWKMARDGALPAWLGRGEDTPWAAIGAQALLASAIFWWAQLVDLLGYIGLTLSVSSALSVFGLMVDVRRRGNPPTSALYPWVPGLYVGVTCALIATSAWMKPMWFIASAATLGLGALLYALGTHFKSS